MCRRIWAIWTSGFKAFNQPVATPPEAQERFHSGSFLPQNAGQKPH